MAERAAVRATPLWLVAAAADFFDVAVRAAAACAEPFPTRRAEELTCPLGWV